MGGGCYAYNVVHKALPQIESVDERADFEKRILKHRSCAETIVRHVDRISSSAMLLRFRSKKGLHSNDCEH